MKKTIILYYSKSGNNKFIAEKLSKDLGFELAQIKPKLNNFLLLILLSGLKIPSGSKKLSIDIKNYDRVILLSPIWIGTIPSPVRNFIKKYKDNINDFTFISVCGSGSEDKDGKCGYENIFKEIKNYFFPKEVHCFEISTKSLNLDNESSKNLPIISEDLFSGEILIRYNAILEIIKNEK